MFAWGIWLKNEKFISGVRLGISLRLMFASCVWYFDRACCGKLLYYTVLYCASMIYCSNNNSSSRSIHLTFESFLGRKTSNFELRILYYRYTYLLKYSVCVVLYLYASITLLSDVTTGCVRRIIRLFECSCYIC